MFVNFTQNYDYAMYVRKRMYSTSKSTYTVVHFVRHTWYELRRLWLNWENKLNTLFELKVDARSEKLSCDSTWRRIILKKINNLDVKQWYFEVRACALIKYDIIYTNDWQYKKSIPTAGVRVVASWKS